ncbi:hypothetical protein CYY_006288 [Polysphondylium violaceum]|uniref:nitric oxide dioxygenase n=1 Tax=Polysphondylium violaceum TaxID=133409 RepID=A0A8J4PSH4_9MYCE|nr:hypothetical protein CYY_006288 [Polysphondylium violaceum]
MDIENIIKFIQESIPLLEEHGGKIATRLYELLFSRNPELLNIFNIANQKGGKQQLALSSTILHIAKHVEKIPEILPAVKKISHKHVALGIKPEHYLLVGESMLTAIHEVLGDDLATPEMMQAWSDVYDLISSAFCDVESEIYEDVEDKSGGWDGLREFVIAKKVEETPDITSFYLKPQDGKLISSYDALNYITTSIEVNDIIHLRHYSISDYPIPSNPRRKNPDYYRITVKKIPGNCSKGSQAGVISNHLHNNTKEGDIINLSAPNGEDFNMHESNEPLILIGAGVGITSCFALMKATLHLQPKRKIIFIQRHKNSEAAPFREELKTIIENNENEKKTLKVITSYSHPLDSDQSDHSGEIDKPWLEGIVQEYSELSNVFLCGPVPFMKHVNSLLKEIGFEKERVIYELFGPLADI